MVQKPRASCFSKRITIILSFRFEVKEEEGERLAEPFLARSPQPRRPFREGAGNCRGHACSNDFHLSAGRVSAPERLTSVDASVISNLSAHKSDLWSVCCCQNV